MPKTRAGPQPLRGGMVRWLPSTDELAQRAPVELTDRDDAILRAAALHGALSTEQIELAFFPAPAAGRASPCTRLYDRLRLLWLWSYLERVERPVSRALGGRRSFLYLLGRAAPPALASRQPDAPAVACRRLDRLDPTFLEHDLKAATLWANIERVRRQGAAGVRPFRRLRWVPERELRARKARVRDPLTGRAIPWLPDGLFAVRYADNALQVALVEVDMGTVSLSRFRRKLRAFEAYRDEGLLLRHWGYDEAEVLVLAHSPRRLHSLWGAAREAVAEGWWGSYFFATFDALDPTGFVRARWRCLDQDPEDSENDYKALYVPTTPARRQGVAS
jgi:hypothetical protein